MLTTLERVRLLGDEFASIPDERLTMFIEDASLEVSSLNLPVLHHEKLARYLAAHLASLDKSKEQAVIREKVDVIERQYSDPNKYIGITATKYGQEYQRLVEELESIIPPQKKINLMVI